MNRKPEDQTTDGKGTKLANLLKTLLGAVESDDADLEGAGTSTADENEGNNDDDAAKDAGDPDGSADAGGDEKTETPDPDEQADEGGDGDEKRYSEKDFKEAVAREVEAKIKDRLRKQKNSMTAKEIDPLKERLDALEKELAASRAERQAKVKAEFEALPDEVKALAPGDVEKPEGISAIGEWLPKAKTLAEALTKASSRKPGNGEGPKALTAQELKDEEALKAEVRKHSIYRNW